MEHPTDRPLDPRVARTRTAVLDAVLAELAEAGSRGLTVESVAARAGVGKATIYRHFSGRGELIAAALDSLPMPPAPDALASGRARVEQLLEHTTRLMAQHHLGARVPALIEAAEHDEHIRHTLHRYVERYHGPLRDAIVRGIADETVPAHVEAHLAAQALIGTILYRRTLTDTALAPEDVPRLVTTVLGPE